MLSERATGGEGGDLSTVSGPRGRGAKWLTEHAAHPGAATREPTRSPRGRQCEYPSQGDHPQNWRATSQGPAGALYVFNTDGILALSAHVAYACVLAGVFVFFYETILTYHISCFLLSLDPSSGVSTLGRQTSLQLHCCTLIFEREPGSESLNTEGVRLIDCVRRKRVTSYFAIPRTGTFPMRSFRSTAERLLMIRSRVIVFFYGDVQIDKPILVFQCHMETAVALSRPEAASNCTTCSLSFGLMGGIFAS